jgi:hypothetical protein
MARAEKRPEWSAALRFGKRGPDFSDMASLEFSIGLPLFARHRQDPSIRAQEAELRRVEAEREATRRAHAAELQVNLAEWEQAGTRLRRYDRELLPLARERTAAALAGYRAGGAAFQLVLDALEAEADTAVERASVADERGRAWAFLRYLEPRQLPRTDEVMP